MIFKNLIRILKSYRFSLIKIIFFELLYLIKGHKGNKFTFSKSDTFADNIPCPYYFLYKIKKKIRTADFKVFLDLGCGSGRVIDFFNKNLQNKNFIGIEHTEEQFSYCNENFKTFKNIKVIQANFLEFDFLQYNADCYFLNQPIKDDTILIEILKKIVNSKHLKKNIFLILVNCSDSILKSLENIQCIERFYLNDKRGFSIYCIGNK